ncbi:MAG TPA: phosphatase PAP2 family protein [Ktedonobacterales bacterium]|jgi:undecaprenyl-diphosphatase
MDVFQRLFSAELRDNWKAFLDINGLAGHSATLDRAMVFGANDLLFALPLLVLLVWFALARWSPYSRWLAARFGAGVAERDRWLGQRALLTIFIGVGLALAINLLLGALIFEPRPFISHPGVTHKLIAHAADASFPSDHETVAMAIALALAFYAGWLLIQFGRERAGGGQSRNANLEPGRAARWGRVAPALVAAALGLIFAIIIGFARVFVGVHYPIDIVGGAVCGAVGDALAFALIPLAQLVYQPIVRVASALRLA